MRHPYHLLVLFYVSAKIQVFFENGNVLKKAVRIVLGLGN